MILAQHSAAPGQGVFVQTPGCLIIAQRAQVGGEVAGSGEGGGVILTQYSAAPGQVAFIASSKGHLDRVFLQRNAEFQDYSANNDNQCYWGYAQQDWIASRSN